jgi:hypothetical protein
MYALHGCQWVLGGLLLLSLSPTTRGWCDCPKGLEETMTLRSLTGDPVIMITVGEVIDC